MTRIDISRWAGRLRHVDRGALAAPFLVLFLLAALAVPLADRSPPVPAWFWPPATILFVLASFALGAVVAARFVAGSKAAAVAVLAAAVAMAGFALFDGTMSLLHLVLIAPPLVFAVAASISILGLARNRAPRSVNEALGGWLGVPGEAPGLGLPLRALRSHPSPPWSLLAAGLLFVGLGLLLAPHRGPVWAPYVQNLAAFGLFALAGGVRLRGQRAAAAGAARAMAEDPRPPVLFLRSFGDDGLSMRAQRVFFLNPLRLSLAFVDGGRGVRFEETLAAELSAHGPVVAIGQPDEPLPQLGAARWYESDATWRAGVDAVMRKARLIVLCAAKTEGLAWEIAHIEELGLWPRVIWVLPPVDRAEAEARWRHVRERVSDPALRRRFESVDLSGVGALIHPDAERSLAVAARKWRQIEYQLAMKLAVAALPQPGGDR